MKTILYFVLSVLTIVYVGFMCYVNISPSVLEATTSWGAFMRIVAQYGGVALVFVFAFVNFFGSPLKAIFFTVLILVAIMYLLTAVAPNWFGGAKALVDAGSTWINF